MISKLKTLKDNSLEQPSLLQRMVAPVKNVFSYFKGLIGGDRETIQQTCSTPNKFIISKKKKFGSLHEASTDNTIKIINLRGENSNLKKNSSKLTDEELKQPENCRKTGFSQDLNNISISDNRNSSPLNYRGLSEKEIKILNAKHINIRENFKLGKNFSQPNEKTKKFEDILSTVKYTVENKTNYLASEINLSQKIIEEENLKKLQKFDGSLKAFNVTNILTNKFDPGKVIYDSSIHSKGNFKSSKFSNIPSQNTADNLSIYSNTSNKSILNYVKTEEVSSGQNKKLFNINNKKRNYDEHVNTCNLVKDEKLSEMAARTNCGDCLKMKYEMNQMKLKLRDSMMEKRNEEKKKKENSKFITSGEETPSTINKNNMTNLLMSGSISLSQSKESNNNSFTSDKGCYKPFKIETNYPVKTDSSTTNQFNFKKNQFAIPEDHENENQTESKIKTKITPQFKSINNDEISSNKQNEYSKTFNEKLEVVATEDNDKLPKKFVNLKNNSEDRNSNNLFNFKNSKKDLTSFIQTKNNKDIFKVNNINIQFIQSQLTDGLKDESNLENNLEDIKDFEKDDKSSLIKIENTNINEPKEKSNPDFNFLNKKLIKNSDPKNEDNSSFDKDLSNNNILLYKSTVDTNSKQDHKYKIDFQVNDANKSNRIENATEDNLADNVISQNQNVDSNLEINSNPINNFLKEKDICGKKDEILAKQNYNFFSNENDTSNNKETKNSVILNNPDNEASLQSLKILPDSLTDNKLFKEKPKGTFVNNMNISFPNKESNPNIIAKTENSENTIPIEFPINNINTSNEINPNNKSMSLLTDMISNPFVQNAFTTNTNKKIIEKANISMNNQSGLNMNSLKTTNSISNLIIPNTPNNNIISIPPGINNLQAVSPSSSTYSNMTFGNKNYNDSTTNYNTASVLNSNAFFGNNITSNNFNNNYIKLNLSTVCEDDGKMSVEKDNPVITANSNRNIDIINNQSNPLYMNMPNDISNNQLHNFTSNMSANVFQKNTNSNSVFIPQIKSDNSLSFPINNMANNLLSTNKTNYIPNSINDNTSNNHPFSNNSNAFIRNNLNTQNENNKSNSNKISANPFLVNKSNNITQTGSGGGLGLFDEHGPPQRRMGSYRR